MTVAKKIENEMKYFEFFKGFFKKNIRRRYIKNPLRMPVTVLGPFLVMAAAAPLMSVLFPESTDNFPMYVLCGEITFIFLFNSARRSIKAVVRNRAYIRAIYIPKHLFVVSAVAENAVPFVVSLVPLLFTMLFTGAKFTFNLLILPLLFALMFMFSLGFSLILAAYGTLIKGIYRLYLIFSAVWLLATPIFYPLSAIPEKIQFFFDANPAVHYIDMMRTICVGGVPSERTLVIATVYSLLVLMLGISLFKSKENRFFLYI